MHNTNVHVINNCVLDAYYVCAIMYSCIKCIVTDEIQLNLQKFEK